MEMRRHACERGPVRGESLICNRGQRSGRPQHFEILQQFVAILWGGERHGDRIRLQHESIPTFGRGHGEPRRILGRWPEQCSPAEGRVSNDRHPQSVGDGKHVLLRSPVCRVVPNHQRV